MIPIDPVSNKIPRSCRVIALWQGNACYCYSYVTIRDKDFKILPVSTVHLDNSSIYYTERIWDTLLAVIASLKVFKFPQSHFYFVIIVINGYFGRTKWH